MAKHGMYKRIVASPGRARKMLWIGSGVALVAVLVIGVGVLASRSDDGSIQASSERLAGSRPNEFVLPVVDVYKDPTCGCCSKWVEHLRAHGFTVRTTDMRDMATFKASHGVPSQARSCHTALMDGYVLEGHVPATDVQRLLKERPAIAGVAVPGMPIGSPGMEVQGAKTQPYNVIAFEKNGSTHVFAAHR